MDHRMLAGLVRTAIVVFAEIGLTAAEAQTLRIGVIGTGRIGSALARHRAAAIELGVLGAQAVR